MNKNPLLPAGEYSLEWRLADGSSVSGVLTLAGEENVTGMAYDLPAEPPSADITAKIDPSWTAWEPGIKPYGVVRGQLRNNLDVVFPEAYVSHQLPGQSMLLAELAIVGPRLSENTELVFDEITFQAGGLTELSGVTPLKTYRYITRFDDGEPFGGTWNADSTQEWTRADGDTMRLHYLASFTAPQLHKLSFTTVPVVTVTGRARSLRDWMSTYVRPVAELTSFATGKPQPVTFASVRIGGRDESSVYGRELTQQRYEAERPPPGALQALVHCGPGGASLTELLAGWGDLKDRYVTFADYFTSISTTPLPVTSRFIALVAALESFHGADDTGSTKLDLRQRLQALADRLPDEIRGRIANAVNPLPDVLQGILQQPMNVWHIMGKARNNLAHGNIRQTDEQLTMLTRLGHTLAVALVLHTFGVPPRAWQSRSIAATGLFCNKKP
ncbi:hypothetical protein [Amycolatopsis circi]|uniref:ApeA N-terminal domain 1-containing protein n=1 Tax=Amycolatopsis circi TaxID=871959 RepID=UPI000E227CED|nr:hypothetical protein [Amycolatopsis circi]